METQYHLVLFLNIMKDTLNTHVCVKIISHKSVSETTFTRGGFIRANVETEKNFSVLVCCV